MKKTILFFIISLAICFAVAYAQYSGGAGDGGASASSVAEPAGTDVNDALFNQTVDATTYARQETPQRIAEAAHTNEQNRRFLTYVILGAGIILTALIVFKAARKTK